MTDVYVSGEWQAANLDSSGETPPTRRCVEENYFEDNHVERPWQVTGDPNGIHIPSRNETYICWHAGTEAWVTRYDHDSNEWYEDQLVGDGGGDDYHAAPSLTVDNDGYCHVIWGGWGETTEMRHGRTDNPYDITSWTVSTDVPFHGVPVTYTLLWTDGYSIYAGFRDESAGTGSPVAYYKSTDNGATWSGPTELLQAEHSDARIYCATFQKDGSDVHLFFREADDTDTTSEKYFHAIFDTTDESLRTIDGVSLSTPLPYSEAVNNCEIADVSELPNVAYFDSRMRARLDNNGNPYIVCHGYSGSGGDADQYYNMFIYYDGSSWSTIEEVTAADGFHAMPAIRLNSATSVDMITAIDSNGKSQLVRYRWDGSSWSLAETLLDQEYENYGASVNVFDPHPDMQILCSEYDGSGPSVNDRSTELHGFAWGESGFVPRLYWKQLNQT